MNKGVGCLSILVLAAIAGSVLGTCENATEERRRKSLSPAELAAEDSVRAVQEGRRDLERRASQTRAAARERVRATLKDPSSAQFGRVWAAGDSQRVACGFVNAKNSFGGYTGEELFIAAGGAALLRSQIEAMRGEDRVRARALLAVCDTVYPFSGR
jgi:hypothetical protein